MIFLLRVLFQSLFIIFWGGIFIYLDTFLGIKKIEPKKSKVLCFRKFIFCFSAIFIFSLATILAGKTLDHFLSSFPCWIHFPILLLAALLLTLLIIFVGIIIPYFIATANKSSGLFFLIGKFTEFLLAILSPLLDLFSSIESKYQSCSIFSLLTNHPTSEKDVIEIMNEGLHAGIFNASEKEMVEGVLELDEQKATSLMTPRAHVVFLDIDDEEEKNWRRIIASGHSEFPVFQTTHDNIVGIVSIKALWANLSLAGSAKLIDLITPPLYVFCNTTASKIIEEFRIKKNHTALVIDEFGVVEGIITLKDVIESILGTLPERTVRRHYPEIEEQPDGSFLVDAILQYQEISQKLKLPMQEVENRYQTIGGFFLYHLGHLPRVGETIVIDQLSFQVFSMNRHRIDKLRIFKNQG